MWQIPTVTRKRLAAVIGAWGATYAALISVGLFFFVYKTLVMPVFLAYAFVLPAERRESYLRAWVPFLGGTVAFDMLRGFIYSGVQLGYRPVYARYVIDLESIVAGVPALPLILQRVSSPALDMAAFLFHAAHFVYFLLIGMVVWHVNPRNGVWLQRAMLLVMAAGLVCYALVPTVPPWMAAEQGLLPPIRHVVVDLYHRYVGEQLHTAFDTNPVAAMPSLHSAFPLACALVGSRTFSRPAAAALWLYALLLIFSVIYLGEHYVVDVLAGAVLAWVAVRVCAPRPATTGS